MSLTDYGAVARSPVRRLATDNDGLKVCPECGRPVGGTRGTHELNIPETADPNHGDLPRTLHAFGYVCDHHPTDVILPLPTDEQASNLPDGWTGIRLRFSDELARYVPVIARELDGGEEQ